MLNEVFRPVKQADYVENAINVNILIENENSSIRVTAFDAHQHIAEHKVETHACAFVLEGEIEFTIETKKYTLSQGEMIIMPKNAPHSLIAKMKSKMLLVRL